MRLLLGSVVLGVSRWLTPETALLLTLPLLAAYLLWQERPTRRR